MGLSVVIGSFFDLPLKTVSLVGATLGPLGFMVTIMLGILESSSEKAYETETVKVKVDDDPFGDVFKLAQLPVPLNRDCCCRSHSHLL